MYSTTIDSPLRSIGPHLGLRPKYMPARTILPSHANIKRSAHHFLLQALLATMALLTGWGATPARATETPTTQHTQPHPLGRAEVDQLLQKARTALLAGKLELAEKLLTTAENAKVRYPVLHFGDTPARFRQDLKKSKATRAAQRPPGKQGVDPSANDETHPQLERETADHSELPLESKLTATIRGSQQGQDRAASPPVLPIDLAAPQKPRNSVASQHQPATSHKTQSSGLLAGQSTKNPFHTPAATDSQLSPVEPQPQPASASSSSKKPAPGLQRLPTVAGDTQVAKYQIQVQPAGAQLPQSVTPAAQQANLELDLPTRLRKPRAAADVTPASARQDATSPTASDTLLRAARAEQTVIARQLSAEIGKRQSEASRLRKTDPQQALQLLQETKQLVEDATLDQGMKSQLNRRVDLSIAETEKYIQDNRAELELAAANQEVLDDIDRQREVRLQVQQRLAELVDQYNTLRDEQRYAQMEVVAKRAYDMAPNDLVAQQIWENAKFLRRTMLNREIDDLTDEGVMRVIQDIRKTGGQALVDSTSPMTFGPEWDDLVKNRTGSDQRLRQTEAELEIKRKLRTKVLPRYTNMPLTEVMDALSELSGINIHLDPRGLSQEGVRSDEQISLSFPREISLESALTLILEPLHLTYVVKNEVLKVTSEQIRDGELVTLAYNVADLVIPIPNFVPSSNMGLAGLLEDAYQASPVGMGVHGQDGPMVVVAGQQTEQPAGLAGVNVMPQQLGGGANSSIPLGGMASASGGAANADFDSLIDLIVSTVEHESWMENGTGEGEIQPFPTNLSLVISQTQSVHEQIADLLEQLRRLQDLQVTIEVRFIQLRDNFFERIGIDFDFNIEDGSGITDLNQQGATFEPKRRSATLGINANPSLGQSLGTFSVDLDVPIRQDSFGLTTPQFGGGGGGVPPVVGQFGFAILSDIEAFFLIEASQGDSRSNVLQAPKVTLFNGQQATIIDAAQVPFVVSVVPVVGEFAAAQQPIIVVLSEGTMMTVQAVVSDDRRYVRMTLVPFFSQIGEVRTFTFDGSETTTTSTDTTDQDDDGNNESNGQNTTVARSGTTVQLPTFEVISVNTTVSVPDGGTVLLGGIKRLQEGRNEAGVPLLSKIPYVDRLFRNVGIGRETDSLMMMVTPHIIIQEEEEERRGIGP